LEDADHHLLFVLIATRHLEGMISKPILIVLLNLRSIGVNTQNLNILQIKIIYRKIQNKMGKKRQKFIILMEKMV